MSKLPRHAVPALLCFWAATCTLAESPRNFGEPKPGPREPRDAGHAKGSHGIEIGTAKGAEPHVPGTPSVKGLPEHKGEAKRGTSDARPVVPPRATDGCWRGACSSGLRTVYRIDGSRYAQLTARFGDMNCEGPSLGYPPEYDYTAHLSPASPHLDDPEIPEGWSLVSLTATSQPLPKGAASNSRYIIRVDGESNGASRLSWRSVAHLSSGGPFRPQWNGQAAVYRAVDDKVEPACAELRRRLR